MRVCARLGTLQNVSGPEAGHEAVALQADFGLALLKEIEYDSDATAEVVFEVEALDSGLDVENARQRLLRDELR